MTLLRSTATPLLALTVGAAAGCVSSPARRPPDIEVCVPQSWAAGSGEESQGAVSPEWWTTFGDAALDRVVGEALDRNHDLRAAAERVAQAAAQARIARADLRPGAELSLNRRRQKMNFIGFPIPGSESRVLSTTSTSVGLSLDISWEPDLWGRIRAGASAARADLDAVRADYSGARLSLAGQTAKAWFALAEAKQQMELARRTVDSYRKTVEMVRDRFRRGVRSSLDLRLALTNLHSAEAALEQRRSDLDGRTRQMEILLGRYPYGALEAPAEIPGKLPPIPAGVPADLVSRRPDLASAERRLAGAAARLVAARRALYPSLRLTASGGTSSNKLHDLLDGDFSAWSLLAGITQPIFQGGRLRAAVKLADARAREAVESFAQSALRAYAEVETLLDAETRLERLEEDLSQAAHQAAAAKRLAEERYRSGLDDFLTVLEAQRRDLDAESRLLAARRGRLDNRVDLYLALGGGFEVGATKTTGEEGRS